jgi:hypothetical protein
MLEVILPLPVVLSAIGVLVGSSSIGFIVDPLALIDVSVHMREQSPTLGSILLPISIVFCSIWPALDTLAVSEAAPPLANVDRSRLEAVGLSFLSLLVGIELILDNSLF